MLTGSAAGAADATAAGVGVGEMGRGALEGGCCSAAGAAGAGGRDGAGGVAIVAAVG